MQNSDEKIIQNIENSSEKMMISVDEFCELKAELMLYKIFMKAVINSVELNWNKTGLTTNGEEVMGAFKLLYPDVYEKLYRKEKDGSLPGNNEADG